jgi:hypothetical protein
MGSLQTISHRTSQAETSSKRDFKEMFTAPLLPTERKSSCRRDFVLEQGGHCNVPFD